MLLLDFLLDDAEIPRLLLTSLAVIAGTGSARRILGQTLGDIMLNFDLISGMRCPLNGLLFIHVV